MKTLIGILCLYVVSIGLGYANVNTSSSHYKIAQELYRVSMPKEMFIQSITDRVESGMPQLFQGNLPKDKVDSIRLVVQQYAVKVVNDPDMEKRLVQGYVNIFNEEELKELLKFYQSHIGQKYVQSQAQFVEVVGTAIQEVTPKYNRVLQREISRVLTGK